MPEEIIPARLGPLARGGFTTAARDVGQRDSFELVGALGVPVQWMSQVHGADVALVTGPPTGPLPRADAVVADAREAGTDLAAGVVVADCAPVLLAAAEVPVVAAVHVGRRGLVAGVLPRALEAMAARGADLAQLHAAVGPAICGRCYEVPERMRAEVAAAVPGTASTTSRGTPAVDVPAGVLGQLAAAGVRRVHHVDRCTYEDPAFFSYRRTATAERFAGVVRTVRGD